MADIIKKEFGHKAVDAFPLIAFGIVVALVVAVWYLA